MSNLIIDPASGVPFQKDLKGLTASQVRLFWELEQLIQQLGLSFFCNHCNKMFGAGADGVRASVDKDNRTIRLTCNHQDRVYTVGQSVTNSTPSPSKN